ncbi:Autophagy protein ATG17-like domain-containing protein [Plasmodiophora brassicae]
MPQRSMASSVVVAIVAETGRRFTVSVPAGESMFAPLALATDIATHDQIVLSDDGELVTGTMIRSPCYVYSRLMLTLGKGSGAVTASSVSRRAVTTRIHVDLDAIRNTLRSRDDALDQFRHGYRALGHLLFCFRRQIRAIHVAVRNLRRQVELYVKSVNDFSDDFRKLNDAVLAFNKAFEGTIARLSQIELHPSVTSGRSVHTLLDCVSEGHIRKTLAQFNRDVAGTANFVAQMEESVRTVERDCDEEASKLTTRTVIDRFPYTVIKQLSAMCSTFRRLLSGREQPEVAPDELVSDDDVEVLRLSPDGLEHLREYVLSDACFSDGALDQAQSEMLQMVYDRLSAVSDLETRIRQCSSRLTAYQEIVKQKEAQLASILAVEQIPEAYTAALVEVIRRRRYVASVADQLASVELSVQEQRLEEIKKRSRFASRYGRFLPRDAVPGLSERPPHYTVNLSKFDESLPKIDTLTEATLPNVTLPDSFFQFLKETLEDEDILDRLPGTFRDRLTRNDSSDSLSGSDLDQISSVDESGESETGSIVAHKAVRAVVEAVVSETELSRVRLAESSDAAVESLSALQEALSGSHYILAKQECEIGSLAEKLTDLEQRHESLTMTAALMFRENKELSDAVSRPHIALADFRVGDCVAFSARTGQLLNINSPNYVVDNRASFPATGDHLCFGHIASVEAGAGDTRLVKLHETSPLSPRTD